MRRFVRADSLPVPARKNVVDFSKLDPERVPAPITPERIAARKSAVPEPLWNLVKDGFTQGLLEKLACPERLKLAYIEGLSPVRFRGALKFGEVVHGTLDHVYTHFRDNGDAAEAVKLFPNFLETSRNLDLIAFREAGLPGSVEDELNEIYGTAYRLLYHYFDFWRSDFTSRKWESLEEIFDVPYTIRSGEGPIETRRRGKFDGTFRTNGKLWLFETKNKSQVTDRIGEGLAIDLQVRMYLGALRVARNGEYPAGVLYNILRRPQLRRKASETLEAYLIRVDEDIATRREHYFVRYEAAFTPTELDEWERDLDAMARLLYSWYRGAYHYRFSPACETKYGPCEFWGVCTRGDRSGLVRREDVFPELVEILPKKG